MSNLHPYEQLCSGMNISLALILQSNHPIEPELVSQSLNLAAYEHPYLRMLIKPSSTTEDESNHGTSLFFIEAEHEPFVALDVHTTLESPGAVLNKLVNEPKPSNHATLRAVL